MVLTKFLLGAIIQLTDGKFQTLENGTTAMCMYCGRIKPIGGGIIGGGIFGIGEEEQTNSLGYVPTVQLNGNSFQGLLD